MNPGELLKLTEEASTVAFHKFILLCKGRDTDLFCFFEGKDSQYYSSRVRQLIKRKYHPISCGNKKTVLDTFRLFKNHNDYQKYSKAFFIDRDFDESVNEELVYETPCYSVENFYANSECFTEVLKNEFSLTEEDKEFKILLSLFKKELSSFTKETLLFNGWYAALKKKKRENGYKSTGVSLDDKLPKDFICLKIGAIKSDYDLKKIRKCFPNAIEVSNEEVSNAIAQLNCIKIEDKLRGKFQMWFFYNFLHFLIEDANKSKTILKSKTKFNVDRANIYTQLSQYAITPECLESYLSRFN